MNYEPRHRAPTEAQHDPDLERREQHPLTDGDLIRLVIELAPTEAAAALVEELWDRHGEPFAAYLTLDGIDRYADDLEAQFTSVYVGRYDDREAVVTDTIASFDWGSDLDWLLSGDPQLRSVVTFDRRAIWDLAADHYEILVRPGSLYAFERD